MTQLAGLILNGGNGGNCLRCPWSLPWCPFKSPNRNLQIPHRGALCQGKIALPLQVRSIRPELEMTGQLGLRFITVKVKVFLVSFPLPTHISGLRDCYATVLTMFSCVR